MKRKLLLGLFLVVAAPAAAQPLDRPMLSETRPYGDLLRECAFSSRTSAFDQVRRLVRIGRSMGGYARQCACFPLDRSGD